MMKTCYYGDIERIYEIADGSVIFIIKWTFAQIWPSSAVAFAQLFYTKYEIEVIVLCAEILTNES